MEQEGASRVTGATGTTCRRCRRSTAAAGAAEARFGFSRSPSSRLLHTRDTTIHPSCSPCARCPTTTSATTHSSILQTVLRSSHSASSQIARREVSAVGPGAVVLIWQPCPWTTQHRRACSFCEGSQPSLMHSNLAPKSQYMRVSRPGKVDNMRTSHQQCIPTTSEISIFGVCSRRKQQKLCLSDGA